jgi:hypothetical protein
MFFLECMKVVAVVFTKVKVPFQMVTLLFSDHRRHPKDYIIHNSFDKDLTHLCKVSN